MDFNEQLKKDTEYFKEMLKQLNDEGRFNDRLPNSGIKYDSDSELHDLLMYEKNLKKPDSLSFWRN